MFGFSRRTARSAWTILLILAVLFFLYSVLSTVLVFMTALFCAYILWPAVNWVQRHAPRWMGRTLALTIVSVLFWGALVTLIVTLGVNLVDQANSLATRLTQQVQTTKSSTPPDWLTPIRDQIGAWIKTQFANGGAALLPYVRNVGAALRGTVSGVLYFVLVPILSFFFIKDGHLMREHILGLFGAGPTRALADDVLEDIHVLLGHYIRVLVTLAMISVIVYSAFFEIIGVPYSVLLAFQAAVLEFIPVIGPLIAGAIMLAIAALAGYPHLWWIVIFWAVYRAFQDYVLSPHLMGQGVEIHPIVVLFGVLAGEQLGGVPGMFFSVPVIAICRIIFVRARRAAERRRSNIQVEAT